LSLTARKKHHENESDSREHRTNEPTSSCCSLRLHLAGPADHGAQNLINLATLNSPILVVTLMQIKSQPTAICPNYPV
jgi:hypothetical protein